MRPHKRQKNAVRLFAALHGSVAGTLAPSLPAGRSALSKADLVRVGMAVVAVSPPGPSTRTAGSEKVRSKTEGEHSAVIAV